MQKPAALAAIALVLVAPAAADETMTISLGPEGTIESKTVVGVPVTVRCDEIETQTSGSVRVELVQQSGNKTTDGVGEEPIVCDGSAHEYRVRVVSGAGSWHPGSATVFAAGRAEGYRMTTVCRTLSDGTTECTTFQQGMLNEGSAGPEELRLKNN